MRGRERKEKEKGEQKWFHRCRSLYMNDGSVSDKMAVLDDVRYSGLEWNSTRKDQRRRERANWNKQHVEKCYRLSNVSTLTHRAESMDKLVSIKRNMRKRTLRSLDWTGSADRAHSSGNCICAMERIAASSACCRSPYGQIFFMTMVADVMVEASLKFK